MKIATFKYTDTKGKETQRTALIINEPTKNYLTLDIGSLSDEEAGMYLSLRSKMIEKHLITMAALDSDFDLTHNLRAFVPERMSNIVVEEVL